MYTLHSIYYEFEFAEYNEFDKLKEFESQVEYLKTTNDTLINISGSYFYNFTPEENLIINLVKEEDNEHDPDAIAAYLNGQKITILYHRNIFY